MTKGNVNDRVLTPDITKDLTGFIYAKIRKIYSLIYIKKD